MAVVHFAPWTFTFPSRQGFVQTASTFVALPSNVVNGKAAVALTGFNIGFSENDHHLFREEIAVRTGRVLNNLVEVKVDFLLRDSSGNIDDPFDGTINVLVIAECVS